MIVAILKQLVRELDHEVTKTQKKLGDAVTRKQDNLVPYYYGKLDGLRDALSLLEMFIWKEEMMQ